MSQKPRFLGIAWLFGAGLLLASLIGANRIMQSRPNELPPTVNNTTASQDDHGVVCFGNVDTETGPIPLWPAQFPQPVTVKKLSPKLKEGGLVKAGDVLIEFDDELAQLQVQKAVAGLDEAKGKLLEVEKKGELALKTWKRLITQQTANADAKAYEARIAQTKLEGVRELFNKQLENKFTVNATADEAEARKSAVIVEQDKLAQLQESKPEFESLIQQAKAAVDRLQATVDEAEYGVRQQQLIAHTDGTILRVSATVGMTYGMQSKQPAAVLLPTGPLLVRAEIEQEFASRVAVGQSVILYDEASQANRWNGKVIRVIDGFLPRRTSSLLPDPFQLNEPRVLESLVSIEPDPNLPPLRIGQRLRLKILFGDK